MHISQFLAPQCILAGVAGGSKKRLLETISQFAQEHNPDIEAEDIFDGLIERERLGSTGVGDGVAIPHCRLEGCDKIIGIFFSLSEPIDFDSLDKQSVDLVFTLIVPSESNKEHLSALQGIASLLGQADIRQQLRAATTAEQLYRILVGDEADQAVP